jgi:hypothetical protein
VLLAVGAVPIRTVAVASCHRPSATDLTRVTCGERQETDPGAMRVWASKAAPAC